MFVSFRGSYTLDAPVLMLRYLLAKSGLAMQMVDQTNLLSLGRVVSNANGEGRSGRCQQCAARRVLRGPLPGVTARPLPRRGDSYCVFPLPCPRCLSQKGQVDCSKSTFPVPNTSRGGGTWDHRKLRCHLALLRCVAAGCTWPCGRFGTPNLF